MLPSLAPVYAQGAGISAIKQYLDTIIAALKQLNGPSIGCLVVNTLAQLEVEDIETRALLEEHFKRQEDAILTAITNENNKSKKLTAEEAEELGRFAVISLQGLSVRFRNATDFEPIEQFTRAFISILETQVGNNWLIANFLPVSDCSSDEFYRFKAKHDDAEIVLTNGCPFGLSSAVMCNDVKHAHPEWKTISDVAFSLVKLVALA